MTMSTERPDTRPGPETGSPAGAGADVASDADAPADRPPASLRWLFLGLVLYGSLGKGFAYAGWPPVFVGEVLLLVVLAAAVRPWMAFPRNLPAVLTALLIAWTAGQLVLDRLVGDVPLLESLRGIAPMYYAGYAFGVYALLRAYEQRAGRRVVSARIEQAMVRLAPWALGVLTLLATFLIIEPAGVPTWPVSGVSMLLTKSGDIAVGLVLFLPALLYVRAAGRRAGQRMPLMALWFVAALLVTFRGRGALLAMVLGLVVMRPHVARLVKGLMVAVVVVLVLYVTGLTIEVRNREVSYDAIGDAIESVLGSAPEDDIGSNYVGTTNWRADWWEAIWADVRADTMLLHGFGWGDNLAVRYGVSPPPQGDEPALRLPHSIFFSLAGRAGVATAVGFLLVPLLTIGSTFRRRAPSPAPMMVQAARGAVVAGIATGLTDIYLEAPQGGILFWGLLGYLWWAVAKPIDNAVPDGRDVVSHAVP